MKKNLLLIMGCTFSLLSLAQNKQLKGKILDPQTNAPIEGVNIQVNEKDNVTTGKDGSFAIDCQDSLQLAVSFSNFETIRKKITNCDEELTFTLTPKAKSLEEIEITATSNPDKSLLSQPASIVKLNDTELKRGTGLFLDDAINANVPGVFMERRTLSAGQQFNIRGYGNGARGTNGVNSNFDNQGSKIYLNGIALTDAEGITLMDDIDFGSIGNVEVVKGPAGSLYGLAIAGAINLQTKRAEKNKVSVGQDYLAGSYGLMRATTHVQIGGERSSVLLNYGKQLYDGFMTHTASHKDFVNFMGDFSPNNKQTITTYIGYSESYDERNGELTIGQYDTLNYSGNPAYINNNAHSHVTSFRAGIGHTYKISKHVSNTTSLFGSGLYSDVSSAGGWTEKIPVNYGTRSTIDLNFPLKNNWAVSGITGIEAQRQDAQTLGYAMVKDSANLSGYNIPGTMTNNKATISKTWSAFTEWTLKMPYDISLTAGVGVSNMDITLYDRLYVAANNKPVTKIPTKYSATYDNLVSPHVALNKVFSKMLSVYASYSTGYKAPTSGYFFIPTTGQVNTGLKPEMGTQYEIGTKGSLLKDKLHYQVAAFNAIFSNKMTAVAVPLNPPAVGTAYSYMANSGSLDNKGVEVLVKYTAYQSPKGFVRLVKPFANFTYSDFKYVSFTMQTLDATKKNVVETVYSGNPVAGVPPVVVNGGVDFESNLGIYANVNYSYRDAMPYTSDNLNKTKSYSLLNSKIGFHRTFIKHIDVDAYFGANNMTSTQYYYMVFLNQLPDAYLPAPREINFFGGLNVKYIF
jgi:iron complex outermembrane recepter protein